QLIAVSIVHVFLFSCMCYVSRVRRCLHSFPTRRSSDLVSSKGISRVAPYLLVLLFPIFASGPVMKTTLYLGLLGTHLILLFVGSDRKSTRLNSSHVEISYAVFCLKKKSDHRFAQVLDCK